MSRPRALLVVRPVLAQGLVLQLALVEGGCIKMQLLEEVDGRLVPGRKGRAELGECLPVLICLRLRQPQDVPFGLGPLLIHHKGDRLALRWRAQAQRSCVHLCDVDRSRSASLLAALQRIVDRDAQ
jgi:hypothetical protein